MRQGGPEREVRMLGYHGDNLVNWSGYADDLELFLENVNDLQKALTILHSVLSKFGLHINIKRTKTMIFKFKYVERNYNSTYPESIVTLEDQPIENVKQFRYLGDEVRFDEPSTGDAEIDLRMQYRSNQVLGNHQNLPTLKFISTREY